MPFGGFFRVGVNELINVGVLEGVNLVLTGVLTWAHGHIFPPQGVLREIGACEFYPAQRRSCVIPLESVDFSYSIQSLRVIES
jgi:hypothetical protein